MVYEFDSRVRYSEVDSQGKLTWLALMDYFQDCSVFQSESLGIGVDYLAENHQAWVLTSWQIVLNSMPQLAERVITQTWAYDMKGFYGYRNFSMNNGQGERLAYANSIWALMDTNSGRPVKVSEEMAGLYGMESQIPMGCDGRKIALPKECDAKEAFVVPAYFMDTNHHMNNSHYVEVALGFVPDDFAIGQIRVEYRKAAVCGDVMIPKVSKDCGKITVVLTDDKDKPYAVVEFAEAV